MASRVWFSGGLQTDRIRDSLKTLSQPVASPNQSIASGLVSSSRLNSPAYPQRTADWCWARQALSSAYASMTLDDPMARQGGSIRSHQSESQTPLRTLVLPVLHPQHFARSETSSRPAKIGQLALSLPIDSSEPDFSGAVRNDGSHELEGFCRRTGPADCRGWTDSAVACLRFSRGDCGKMAGGEFQAASCAKLWRD